MAHAAGQLMRIVMAEAREPDELERGLDARRVLGRRHAASKQAEADILLDAHPGKQAGVLEHHGVRHRPAGRLDVEATARLAVEAGEDAQQGRLAAAARPDDAEEFARRHVQVDVVERDNGVGAVAVNLAQLRDLDRRAAPLNAHRYASWDRPFRIRS